MRARLALAPLLALYGCAAVGPNYHMPANAAVNAPAARGAFHEAGAGTQGDPLPPRWWHLYDDPALDALEEQALAANTDLRIAGANLAHARAVVDVANGAKEPEFSVSAQAERARLSGESFLLFDPIPVATLGEVNAGVRYQIDLFGQIRRQVEAARADEAASEATVRAVKVTLAAEVARAYLAHCAANEAVAIGTEAIAVDHRALDIARRLKAAGRAGDSDVTRAEGRLAQITAMVPAQRARGRAAQYRLAYLLGKPPADAPTIACTTIPTIAHALPVGDGAALIARRPDVHVAERQLAGATARIGVATAALYPHIGIGLSGGSFGFLKDLGTAPANMWSIGGLLQWTIPGGGERARVRAANADADAALARFDGTVLAALRETETALAAYAEDHNRAVSLDQALASAAQETADTQRLRAAGRSPLAASIGAAQSTLVARAAQANAREAIAMDQVNVFLALGGGW
ncbi:efflux transporter outer membrane subunit [Novosphingobium sp.]|uniref:efflux transporter outer membrane subunit n=1 Tax=Novosphingobium sp. TaxID=1874826 RepID=UPI003D0C2394